MGNAITERDLEILRYAARHRGPTAIALYEGVTGQGAESPGADITGFTQHLAEAGLLEIARDPASFDLRSPLCAWLTWAGLDVVQAAGGA